MIESTWLNFPEQIIWKCFEEKSDKSHILMESDCQLQKWSLVVSDWYFNNLNTSLYVEMTLTQGAKNINYLSPFQDYTHDQIPPMSTGEN